MVYFAASCIFPSTAIAHQNRDAKCQLCVFVTYFQFSVFVFLYSVIIETAQRALSHFNTVPLVSSAAVQFWDMHEATHT